MSLPPKDDPRRPLHLAVRSTRLLGIVLLGFGGFAALLFLMIPRQAGVSLLPEMFLGLLVYFVPAVIYLITSVFLKRRHLWAIVVGIVLASVNLVLILAAFGAVLFVGWTSNRDAAIVIPIIVLCLFILALAQLIYHLAG